MAHRITKCQIRLKWLINECVYKIYEKKPRMIPKVHYKALRICILYRLIVVLSIGCSVSFILKTIS